MVRRLLQVVRMSHPSAQTPTRDRCAGRHVAALGLCAALLLSAGCAGRTARPVQPAPRASTFIATAYCQSGRTASGARVREGIVAADPSELPIGTVIRVSGLSSRYNREYRVMDTGRAVRGHHIDVYMKDCREAIGFGRRDAIVTVLRPPPAMPDHR